MDRLLNALGRFIKSALWVMLGLCGLVAVIAVLSAVNHHYTVTVPTEQVTVAKFALRHKYCADPQYPMLVSFHNQSSKTVLAINFEFEAYVRGRSTNIAEWNLVNDDTIVKPGHTSYSCWSRPALKLAPTYEVTASDGHKFEVTAPQGANEADVISFVKQKYYSAIYVVLPDNTEIEFPEGTDEKHINRVTAETWAKRRGGKTSTSIVQAPWERYVAAPSSPRLKGWEDYQAKALHKPIAYNKKTNEIFILDDDSKWTAPKIWTNAQTGEKEFFDGAVWRPSPFKISKEKVIKFLVTMNVQYKLKKSTVDFQD